MPLPPINVSDRIWVLAHFSKAEIVFLISFLDGVFKQDPPACLETDYLARVRQELLDVQRNYWPKEAERK